MLLGHQERGRGIVIAVNHDGDSDSTEGIASQLLGIQYRLSTIPSHWSGQLEMGT